jgi:hypothetical protein
MAKARRTAVHRTNRRIDKHEDECQRAHVKMQNAVINAFLHAVSPYLSEEITVSIRRAMVEELGLARRKHSRED